MKHRRTPTILFDLDGTLLDTAPDLAGAVNDMRAERGMDALPLAELAPLCSMGGRGMLDKGLGLKPEHPTYRATYAAFIDAYRLRMTRETLPYEGIRDLLRELHTSGSRWGVVTNKSEALAVPLMDAMAFNPAPGCVIGGDSAGVAKPDPAPIFLACQRMGATASGCIYIGDSERDIAAGRAAGMPTIGVAYGYIQAGDDIRAWQADRVVESPAGLREAINQLRTQLAC